jgi:hypothetical protein
MRRYFCWLLSHNWHLEESGWGENIFWCSVCNKRRRYRYDLGE